MDSARRRLVIFVKQPVLGRVKTRLAADIGLAAATRWYRTTVQHLIRNVGRDQRWTTYLAIDPGVSASFFRGWLSQPGLRLVPQGRGELGARMGRMFALLPPGPVQIIGSDIPAITCSHIVQGFRALGEADVVLGPSEDGGYWLIGQKRVRPQRDLFTGVRWSSRHALSDTLANVRGRTALLETLRDVDRGQDLPGL